jgi:hypothetical protein
MLPINLIDGEILFILFPAAVTRMPPTPKGAAGCACPDEHNGTRGRTLLRLYSHHHLSNH